MRSIVPPRLRRIAVLAPALATALATACSSDSPTQPKSSQPVDVAALMSELSTPGMAGVAAVMPTALPLPTIAFGITGTSCPYDGTSRSFVCAPTTSNGLTIAVSYQLLDAAGNPQGANADRSTTAAMRTVTTTSGTLSLAPSGSSTLPVGALTVTGRQDMTLSGLLGATHTLNGTSSTKLSGTLTFNGAATPVSSTMTQTIKDLVTPASTGAPTTPSYPTSGTITFDASSTIGTGAPAITTHGQMVFNGTSTATLTITSGGTTQRCTVNLAAPSAPTCVVGG